MHGVQIAGRLSLHNHLSVYNNVRLILADDCSLVAYTDYLLIFDRQAASPKFEGKCILIYFLKKPGAKRIEHFEGSTQDLFRQISFDQMRSRNRL